MKNILYCLLSTNTFFVLSFFLLLTAVVGLFLGETYIVEGNLHDLWIPQMGAYAIKSDRVLHHEFHTFFGFFYNGMNYLSLLLIENFSDIFNSSDMIVLSSTLFFIVVVMLSFLIKTKYIPWCILLFIFSHIFQARDIEYLFSYDKISWYGSYNFHLWSLLFLQITHIFSCSRQLKKNHLNRRQLLSLCLVQTLCIFIALNYKINFFASSSLVALSIFFFLTKKFRFYYTLISIFFFSSLTLLTFLFLDYSYYGYYNDILHAIESRNDIYPVKISHTLSCFALFLMIQYYKNTHQNIPLKKEKYPFIKSCFFHALIWLAVIFALMGNSEKAAIYYFITILLYVLVNIDSGIIRNISHVLTFYFFIINLASIIYISQKKDPAQKYEQYKTINLMSKKQDYLIKKHTVMYVSKLYTKLHGDKIDPEKIFLKLSYSSDPLIRGNQAFHNTEYYNMIKDSVLRVKSISSNANDLSTILSFINPLPLLLNTEIPIGTYHWIHFSRTFSSRRNIHNLYGMIKESDFIYLPVLSIDEISQKFLNCFFYRWNLERKRFNLYSINKYGLLFVKNKKMEEYNLKSNNLLEVEQDAIKKSCSRFKALSFDS